MSNYLNLGEPLSQKLQDIIKNNVRIYDKAPYSYVVYQNKHIPNSRDALYHKVEEIYKFAKQNMGYVKISGKDMGEIKPFMFASFMRINGVNREVVIEMNCACVAAKAFDALIPQDAT